MGNNDYLRSLIIRKIVSQGSLPEVYYKAPKPYSSN